MLHPNSRDTLVRVFDEHFVEGQERYGMRIVGQFRDLADPNRFVWIRGFSDMEARKQALEGFYTGPVWQEHAPLANTTMIDHTNVLLLKPARPHAGFRFDPKLRPGLDGTDEADGVVVATIYQMSAAASPTTVAFLESEISAAFAEERAALLAQLVTETAPNTFPRLPVREGTSVFVWFASYASEEKYRQSLASLTSRPRWKTRIAPQLEAISDGKPPESMLLQPTRRSFLRHRDTPSP